MQDPIEQAIQDAIAKLADRATGRTQESLTPLDWQLLAVHYQKVHADIQGERIAKAIEGFTTQQEHIGKSLDNLASALDIVEGNCPLFLSNGSVNTRQLALNYGVPAGVGAGVGVILTGIGAMLLKIAGVI